MVPRKRGCSLAGASLVVGLGLGAGAGAACQRREATVPPASEAECNPADECGESLGGSTIRQHSDEAVTVTSLSQGCPYAAGDVPPLAALDDGSIPEINRGRSRRSNYRRGDAFLQDIDLHEHMMGIQDDLFACVDLATCYADGAKLSGYGELDFDFELHPDGHVVAVSVRPSSGLDHPSIIACARRALASYRFPQYDGGQMFIHYTVSMEEVPDA